MMRHRFRYGPLVFRDPLLLCGALYVLLYFDASGFLRLGLLAAFLHEWGHIGVYLALFGQFPVIEVTLTGFCMRTRGREMTLWQTALLAVAGPAVNFVLAGLWMLRLEQRATRKALARMVARCSSRSIQSQCFSGGQPPDRGLQPPAHPAAGWGTAGGVRMVVPPKQ